MWANRSACWLIFNANCHIKSYFLKLSDIRYCHLEYNYILVFQLDYLSSQNQSSLAIAGNTPNMETGVLLHNIQRIIQVQCLKCKPLLITCRCVVVANSSHARFWLWLISSKKSFHLIACEIYEVKKSQLQKLHNETNASSFRYTLKLLGSHRNIIFLSQLLEVKIIIRGKKRKS